MFFISFYDKFYKTNPTWKTAGQKKREQCKYKRMREDAKIGNKLIIPIKMQRGRRLEQIHSQTACRMDPDHERKATRGDSPP